MKLISWILIFCLCSNLFASTGGNDLASVVNEAKYALTVEWDQKDKEKLETILNSLKTQLKELRAQGLSQEEILAYVEKTGNAAQVERIKTLIYLNKGAINEENIVRFVQNEILPLGTKGASWNSGADTFYILGTAVLIGILVVIAIAFKNDSKEQGTCLVAEKVQRCGYEDVCVQYSNPHDYMELNTCQSWTEEYSCWLEDKCVEWAK